MPLNSEGLIVFEKEVELLPHKPRPPLERKLLTDAEIMANVGGTLFIDVELYENYFLLGAKLHNTGKFIQLEADEYKTFNPQFLSWLMHNYRTVGFNSIYFDLLIIWLAYHTQHIETLKQAANDIILGGVRDWQLQKDYNFKTFKTDHIDLIEVAPLSGSLKLYMARLHCPRIQELPYPDTKWLEEHEKEEVKQYNCNDLDGTEALFDFMKERVELREAIGNEYHEDLRSKSDAQMAEIVLSKEISKLNGKLVERPDIKTGETYYYFCPHFLQFKTPTLIKFLEVCKKAKFKVNENGYLDAPESIAVTLAVGDMEYSFGIGGLHSKEKTVKYVADETYKLTDRDVVSYYPNCILNLGLYPRACGPNFLTVFKGFKDARVVAKRAKNFTKDKGLKIFLNGTSGKFSDRWSKLRSPQLTMQMNLTCQLSILMLIEMITLAGMKIVSANTDGITIYHRRDEQEKLDEIIKLWEGNTGFETEETLYKSYHARDVNAYFAVKEDVSVKKNKDGTLDEKDRVKKKGPYSEVGSQSGTILDTNPIHLICSDAIEALLSKGVPIEETIKGCKDFTRFITVRQAKAPGAHKDREYLGKVVRWYYAKGMIGSIRTVATNNQVADSEGAKPCMDLPDSFPDDIDYNWYITRTREILYDIGYLDRPKQLKFF